MNLPSRMIRLVSLNTGRPAVLGQRGGQDVLSAIYKTPVPDSEVLLGQLGIVGDAQVDTSIKGGKQVHGGSDKAVYAYPSEHFPLWAEELGRLIGPGSFGENLTIAGATEDTVYIGDIWQLGEAVLEVTKPRRPCYKLNLYFGRDDMIKRMRQNARCGWYLRVLNPRPIPTSGEFHLLDRMGDAISVQDAFLKKARTEGDWA